MCELNICDLTYIVRRDTKIIPLLCAGIRARRPTLDTVCFFSLNLCWYVYYTLLMNSHCSSAHIFSQIVSCTCNFSRDFSS